MVKRILALSLGILMACQGAEGPEDESVDAKEALVGAEKHLAEDEFAQAAALLEPVVGQPTANEATWMAYGQAQAGLGDHKKAAFAFGRAFKVAEDPHPALFAAANAWKLAGQLDQAQRFYDAALDVEPNSAHEYLAAAGLCEDREDIGGAIHRTQEGLKAHPNHLDLMVRLAHLKVLTGDFETATSLLEEASAQDGAHLGAIYGKIGLQIAQGDKKGALEGAQAIHQKFPEEPETHLWLARAHFLNRAHKESAAFTKSGLELAGDCTCTEAIRAELKALDLLLKTAH